MRNSWWCGRIAVVGGALASSAFATPQHAEVHWTGTASCAEGPRIEAEVERLLAHAPPGDATVKVDARVEQLGAQRYRLVLETSESGNSFRREIEAASCAELTKPAALIVALSIDPQATARVLAQSAPVASSGALPADPQALPEPGSRASPAPAAAVAALPATPIPVTDTGAKNPSNPASAGVPWSPYVRPAVVFDAAVLPAPSTGFGLAVGLAREAWRFELGVFYLPARFAESGQSVTKGGDISLAGAQLAGCLVPLREPLELGPCLGVEAGVLHGEGIGVSDPEDDDIPWLAARAGGRVAFAFGRSFGASLRADGLFRIGRGEFRVENLGPIHDPGAVGLRLEAGIELGLP